MALIYILSYVQYVTDNNSITDYMTVKVSIHTKDDKITIVITITIKF